MKYITATIVIAFTLVTILVSCIVVKDSKIDNSNLFREDINGNKESGIDLDGECSQTVTTCPESEDKK